jgi:hypothetical protein
MAKGTVANIVKKARETHDKAVDFVNPGNVGVSIDTEIAAVPRVPLKGVHHLGGCVDDSEAVRVPGVRGAWIDLVGHRQLAHAAEPLY